MIHLHRSMIIPLLLLSVFLVPPSAVYDSGAILLALLQQLLVLPLIDVAGVHIAAGLDAESAPRATSRHAGHFGHVGVLAGVELERRFGAEDLEVDLAARVARRDELGQRSRPGVDWDGVRGGRRIDDEAVVDVRVGRTEQELGVGLDLGEWRWSAGRNTTVIDGEVGACA